MPHLTLELSKDLKPKDERALLVSLNSALYDSGQFKIQDIKSRLYYRQNSLIGFGDDGEHFVVAHLAMMAGRTDDVKSELVGRVMAVLEREFCHQNVQCAVNLTELSGVYQKAVV